MESKHWKARGGLGGHGHGHGMRLGGEVKDERVSDG